MTALPPLPPPFWSRLPPPSGSRTHHSSPRWIERMAGESDLGLGPRKAGASTSSLSHLLPPTAAVHRQLLCQVIPSPPLGRHSASPPRSASPAASGPASSLSPSVSAPSSTTWTHNSSPTNDILGTTRLRSTDLALCPISTFANLQILHLIRSVSGLYKDLGITDIVLTILAGGCKRLVKLEFASYEGSYDRISAIGRCCHTLEELIITDQRMEAGWLTVLSFCANLNTLKLQDCKRIDDDPEMEEYLSLSPTIERLQFQRCQLRDKRILRALFMVCEGMR